MANNVLTVDDASATSTIAAAVLLPLLVPLLLNDGSLLPLLVLTVKLPQWHSGVLLQQLLLRVLSFERGAKHLNAMKHVMHFGQSNGWHQQ